MKKLTFEQIKEIKELYKNGVSQLELSKKYKVRPSTIAYHTIPEIRTKVNNKRREKYSKLTNKEKRDLYLKQKEYSSNYLKERYHNDSEFRARQQERAREYKRRKKK